MTEHDKKRNMDQRDALIDSLTKNIVNSVKHIIDPANGKDELKKLTKDIKERLSFETSVLLNESVTKLSPATSLKKVEEPQRLFERFGKNFLYQHMLMFISVIILIVSGIPLKFPTFDISKFIIVDLMGGIQNSTLIHRIGAVGLIIVSTWHFIYIIISKVGRRDFFLMIPRPRDIIDFFATMKYFIGKSSHGPKFGRFSFIEKFDYWAVYWGMVIMIGSGLILWFKELFPKYIFDIGREAHSDEGLLATLAIVVWHFYNVHFNPEVFPMSWVWWHGNLTEKEMKHHHPLEYAEIIKADSKKIINGTQEQTNLEDKD